MTEETQANATGLSPVYRTYERQKCFIAYVEKAEWSPDLLRACEAVLSRSEFNLEADYSRRHFYPGVPLWHKTIELIANARYGIYDLSYWHDSDGSWHMPSNVLIELGMAIALNRPMLLLRHKDNRELALPECLKSMGGPVLEFSGEPTLQRALQKYLPSWVNTMPGRDWWNRYCVFGDRLCEYRAVQPRDIQWKQRTIECQILDGPHQHRVDFRSSVREVLTRFGDIQVVYLDDLPLKEGHDFLLCVHCQTVRSTSCAIYLINPHTPAEAFISIGMRLALEMQFEYQIPQIFLTEHLDYMPSLLRGYEVLVARNDRDRKASLRESIPSVIQTVRNTEWKPRPLPFAEILPSSEGEVKEFLVQTAADGTPDVEVAAPASEAAYRYLASRYGLGYYRLRIECDIHPDGSAVVTRQVTVDAHSLIDTLDTFLVIPGNAPEGTGWKMDSLSIRSMRAGHNVSLEATASDQGRLSAVLRIGPPLQTGDRLVYEMTELLPAGLYSVDLTEEEMGLRAWPYDYFGWSISRPTRALHMTVRFPGYRRPVEWDHEVRYASAEPGVPTQTYHPGEGSRTAGLSSEESADGRLVLAMDVDYPQVGLIYIMRWLPLLQPQRGATD